MPHRDLSLVKQLWQRQPDIDPWPVHRWIDLMYRPEHAFRIEFSYEDWLSSQRNTPPPDLVEWVSWYGYTRLRLQNWKLPIDLSPVEFERWREGGYYVTVADFQEELAKVAAGFLSVAGSEPRLTVRIIGQQLADKLAELDRMVSLPLERFTPKEMPEQIRAQFEAHGYTGAELEDAVDEAVLESDHIGEMEVFDKPFALRQQLASFEWAMEKFRMFALSEIEPGLNLPNQALHDALMAIDLNGLHARFAEADFGLRKIWEHLAKFNCYDLNADDEPEQFWWRHWNTRGKPKK